MGSVPVNVVSCAWPAALALECCESRGVACVQGRVPRLMAAAVEKRQAFKSSFLSVSLGRAIRATFGFKKRERYEVSMSTKEMPPVG